MINQSITTKIKPRKSDLSAQEWVYSTLYELILSGDFAPGSAVTLRSIAHLLNVSPMPVREAVTRLISEGAFDISDKRRVSIAKMDQTKFKEILYTRLQLEPKLAELALPNIKNKHIKLLTEIDENLNQAIASGNVENYTKYNYQFHFGIYQKADSSVLLNIVRSLWLQFSPFYRIVAGRIGTQAFNDFHKTALNAIKTKNSKNLACAIYDDINEGMTLLKKCLNDEFKI